MSEKKRFRVILLPAVFGLLLLNVTVYTVVSYENRPRARVCVDRMKTLAEYIGEYVNEKTGKNKDPDSVGVRSFPDCSIDSLMKTLTDSGIFNPEENPGVYDVFLCPFSDSERGESDLEGTAVFKGVEKETVSDRLLVWEREIFHHDGKRACICTNHYGVLEVRLLEPSEFKFRMEQLKKNGRDRK